MDNQAHKINWMNDDDEKSSVEAITNEMEIDVAAEKLLVRKIDMYLMPAIFVLYLFSFVDRANIGLAEVAGMGKALNLTSHQYYIAVIMWVVGYIAGSVPSNMIISRTQPSIFLPMIMFLWGTVAAAMAAVTKPAHLIALRLLLGIFEAGFSPGVFFLISTWYTKYEQSKRFFVFLSAGILSGAFGGLAAGGITSALNGAHGIPGWRWLFLVEGVATVGTSLIPPFFLLDFPGTSKWLSPAERMLAEARLTRHGVTTKKTTGGHISTALRSLGKAASNWRLWLITFGFMTIPGSLSIVYFYPALVKGLGYSSRDAQYMTAPLYLVALFVALPVCWYVDRHPERRGIFASGTMLFGCLFSALTAGVHAYAPRYVFLCLMNSAMWTSNALGLSFAAASLAGVDMEVRAISLAIMNACGGTAQLYGSALFPAEQGPAYLVGFSTIAATLAFGSACYMSAHFLFRRSPFTKSSAL